MNCAVQRFLSLEIPEHQSPADWSCLSSEAVYHAYPFRTLRLPARQRISEYQNCARSTIHSRYTSISFFSDIFPGSLLQGFECPSGFRGIKGLLRLK